MVHATLKVGRPAANSEVPLERLSSRGSAKYCEEGS